MDHHSPSIQGRRHLGQHTEAAGTFRRNASDHLRVKHLRMLELIDLRGSLSNAAHDLHLSQPAVTKLLHDIEAVFGPNLVERGPRGGRLTPAGRAVMVHLRAALTHLDLAANQKGDPLPLLRVGLLPVAAMRLLSPAIAHLRSQGVALRLDLQETSVQNLLSDVATGRRDCAIGRMDSKHREKYGADLVVTPLLAEALAVAASLRQPLPKSGRKVTLEQLAQASWVLTPQNTNTRQLFDQLFLDIGMPPPRPIIESASFHTNLHLVAHTDLLTIAPVSGVEAYTAYGLVRRVHTTLPRHESQLVFITTAPALEMPAVVQLRDALLAIVDNSFVPQI
jgi:molybdate transport repressor ModE-like protein